MSQTVGIAELKSRLSAYLRLVRDGNILTVLDRDTPVARLVPVEETSSRLSIRRPPPGSPAIGAVALPPPLEVGGDVMTLLEEERGAR